jgi:hypothetical protein
VSRSEPTFRRVAGALVLAAATTAHAAPPAPVYVRGLELPVADDAIG